MAKKPNLNTTKIEKRGPVIVIMGHVDHGKSTILDYIRKTNTVDGEVGGITQHISAYETVHNDSKMTFLDTPGHEAFAATRSRGASIADLAILVVSAEDGVKEQTLSALNFIKKSEIPLIVAINKIDSPKADVEKTKYSLIEHELYLEGMGGNVSYVLISAKTGEGIDELLDIILLTSDLEDLQGDRNANATGYVLESSLDSQKGISATLVIKNGSLKPGTFVVSGKASSPVRIVEDFAGKMIKEATFSQPVKVSGFDILPKAGGEFFIIEDKKELQKYFKNLENNVVEDHSRNHVNDIDIEQIPLIIKADVTGSVDAILHQLGKVKDEKVFFKVLDTGVGEISETDVKKAGADSSAIIIGFNSKISKQAKDAAQVYGIDIKNFNIIYELTEYLESILEKRRPREMVEKITGELKVIRVFSWTNRGGVVGGKVKEGEILKSDKLKILRRNEEIGIATIKELQKAKQDTDRVILDEECGIMVSSKYEISEGDRLRAFNFVEE